jgi:type IV secretion system protein VirD4
MHHSNSRNEQLQKVPLMAVDEVLKLDQGECVFINPAYKGGGEASVPLRLKLRVPKKEIKLQERSEELWRAVLCDRLTQRMATQQIPAANLDAEADARQQAAERQFPPKEKLVLTKPSPPVYPANFFDADPVEF